MEIKDTMHSIHASDLTSILDQYPEIKVLSLDFFDTILWRKTATPIDVFFDLQNKPGFKSLGFSASLRCRAEDLARQLAMIELGSNEVQLREVYTALYPSLSDSELNVLVEEEIQSELEATYPFPPVIDLILKAHAKKLKIIVVSDTYFNRQQIKRLLGDKLSFVAELITNFYCSSEYQKSKVNGLFSTVLAALKLPPQSVLHIGDHPLADLQAADKNGMHALQLIHHDQAISELTRMRTWSALILDPAIRHARPLYHPYHGVYAASILDTNNPATMIGYAALGTIMHAFSSFIVDKIDLLRREGKQPKVAFLMRDAYLPLLACEAITDDQIGTPVRISRFSAYAASFRSRRDINQYVTSIAGSLRFKEACAQLLIPDNLAEKILSHVETASNPMTQFISLMQNESIHKIIIERSKQYCQRLLKYIRQTIRLDVGDTLVFVDLGYTGTAQNKLEPIFREELGVDIYGCYLIALNTAEGSSSRCGLLEPSWCDERQLDMLVAYIALLEQLCTSPDNSVVDFDENGNPVTSCVGPGLQQHSRLKLIQSECIRFVNDAKVFLRKTNSGFSNEILRDAAMSELGRLLFMPTQLELDFLKSFKFDLNLGTRDLLPIFNEAAGLEGLRKRGLLFMEKNLASMRTNYPAELRSAGMELVFTLMTSHRYGLNPRMKDMSFRSEKIAVIAARDHDEFQTDIEALPTYDGFYSLIVPMCEGDYQAQILFGRNYRWLQINSIEYISESALFSNKESQYTLDAWHDVTLNQITCESKILLQCHSSMSAIVIKPSAANTADNCIARITFRPLVSSG